MHNNMFLFCILGVSWVQAKRRWNCSISVGNKTKSLGTYMDEEEAARAYDEAAIKEHYPCPILNFWPDGRYGGREGGRACLHLRISSPYCN